MESRGCTGILKSVCEKEPEVMLKYILLKHVSVVTLNLRENNRNTSPAVKYMLLNTPLILDELCWTYTAIDLSTEGGMSLPRVQSVPQPDVMESSQSYRLTHSHTAGEKEKRGARRQQEGACAFAQNSKRGLSLVCAAPSPSKHLHGPDSKSEVPVFEPAPTKMFLLHCNQIYAGFIKTEPCREKQSCSFFSLGAADPFLSCARCFIAGERQAGLEGLCRQVGGWAASFFEWLRCVSSQDGGGLPKPKNKSWSVSAKALGTVGGLHICACQTARLVITLSHTGRGEMPAKYAMAPHPHNPQNPTISTTTSTAVQGYTSSWLFYLISFCSPQDRCS